MSDSEADCNESRRLLPSTIGRKSPNYLSCVPTTSKDHSSKSETQMPAPDDRFFAVYIIFYILGLGTLLPWNFFITANDYWMYKFRNTNSTSSPSNQTLASDLNGSLVSMPTSAPAQYNQLQSLFQSALSICTMLPIVIFQFLNTLLQQRIHERTRMLGTLTVMFLVFVLTAVFVQVDTSDWQEMFFGITLASVVLMNSCSAVFQSSLFGIVAGLPSKYMQALMAGQSMGGVFAALAMILAVSVDYNPVTSAFGFFLTAIVVIALNGILYILLSKNKFFLYFHKRNIEQDQQYEKDFDSAINMEEEKLRNGSVNSNGLCALEGGDDVWQKRSSVYGADETDQLQCKVKTVPPITAILKKTWVYCFSVIFTFFITLACFPSITASVISISEDTRWRTIYFTPVTCFLLFNVTDWLGRTLAGHLHVPSQSNTTALLVCVLLRGAFPFLFALCNAQPRSAPVIFHHDVYFIVFMCLFGLSNGHLGTLVMQYGPNCVDPQYATTAGSLLAFMISVGLALGAGFSFAIKAAIA